MLDSFVAFTATLRDFRRLGSKFTLLIRGDGVLFSDRSDYIEYSHITHKKSIQFEFRRDLHNRLF